MTSPNFHRLVHLDLKGGPPKPGYLKSVSDVKYTNYIIAERRFYDFPYGYYNPLKLYPLFVKWGVTGLIIEWEDCFPYKNNLEMIWNKLYSLDDAEQLIDDAKEVKFEVIPLIQTFGHLEFVLKHRNFVSLREVPLFPSSLCPSHPDSIDLITGMVEQVVEFHTGIKFIHIGADEVWHMGLCDKCKSRLDSGETKEDLFLKHIRKVVEMIKVKWPGINVIMWDDMLREMDEATLQTYSLKSVVEPMIWHYSPADNFSLGPDLLRKYSYFDNIWIAGAFKGATGGSQLLPVVNHHASNILHWTCLLSSIKSNTRGIALTGWSRYDHFAALCELLPTSLPSLGVCLSILEDKNYSPATIARIDTDLGYSKELNPLSPPSDPSNTFTHHGWGILTGISKFMNLKQSINLALNCEQLETWMNTWQVSNNTVNPMQLVPLVPVLNMYLNELNDLEKFIAGHMTPIFFEATIEEWMGTYLIPMRKKLQDVIQIADEQIAKSSKFVDEALKASGRSCMTFEMDC